MRPDDVSVSRQGPFAVINHTKFQIKFNLSKGTWDYIDPDGDTIIRNGCVQITLRDGAVIKTEDSGTREFVTALPQADAFGDYHQIRFSHEAVEQGVRINTYLNCYNAQPAVHLKVGVENLKPEPLHLDSMTVLGVSANRGSVFPGKSVSDCYLFINMPPVFPGVSKKLYEGFLLSENDSMHPSPDGVLHHLESGKSIVFGFLPPEKWWPHIQVGCQPDEERGSQSAADTPSVSGVTPWALYHQGLQPCDPGEEILSETAYINFIESAAAAYKHYTALLAAQRNAEPWSPEPCTTVSYPTPLSAWTFSDTSAAAVLTQIDDLAENPLFRPGNPGGIHYIQFDIGSGSHDWEELRTTLNQVHLKGFKGGIRIDPFSVALDSELIRQHPEYCIQQKRPTDRRGSGQYRRRAPRSRNKPATVHLPDTGREITLLDISHPAAQQHLREQIQRMVNGWRCSFINVDFTAYTVGLTNVLHNLQWYDATRSAVQLYRFAVQVLRDTIQEACSENLPAEEDVLFVGYNAISPLGIGSLAVNAPLLNSHFSTGAASARATDQWHHPRGTKYRLTRYAAHLREHNVLWRHLFGELAGTESRPINEVIVEMTAAALSGGGVLCTGTPSALTSSRAAHFSKIFPLIGQAATPIDLYAEPAPKIWSLPISTPYETWYLAAIFNWNDHEEDVYFELASLGLPESTDFLVHDFWMHRYLGQISQNLNLFNIPPRSAKLLCFREEQDVPQLLATDMHYTQGGVEILSAGWDTHSYSYLLVCNPLRHGDGTCFIHVPEDYLPVSASAYGSDYHYSWAKPIYQLTFTAMQPGTLVHAHLRFAKTSGGTVPLL